ncbi:hypothetical protein JXB28_04995 [Candidatus Woesearchaeota archaeon]|nr:hypothetical protein [Candidatus Woesearchaeota archaeon]
MHHKNIILPVLCSIIIPFLLIFLFLNLSGLNPLLKQFVSASNEFDQQKSDYLLNKDNIDDENYSKELVNYLGKDSRSSTYNEELAQYLDEKDYDWSSYKQLLNAKNLVMLVVFLFIGIIGSFYFSCMSYAIIALTIKKEKFSSGELIATTNRFLFKLLSLRVLVGFIVAAPIIISLGIIASLFFLNTILGALSIFVFVILFIVYIITVTLRLIFATPSLYMGEPGAVKSIKHSYDLTKGHLKQVLIIFFMIYGITIFMNSFIGQPLYGTYSNLLFEPHWIKISINLILVLLFLVLEAFVFTFEHIFLFYSYIDFKEIGEVTQ